MVLVHHIPRPISNKRRGNSVPNVNFDVSVRFFDVEATPKRGADIRYQRRETIYWSPKFLERHGSSNNKKQTKHRISLCTANSCRLWPPRTNKRVPKHLGALHHFGLAHLLYSQGQQLLQLLRCGLPPPFFLTQTTYAFFVVRMRVSYGFSFSQQNKTIRRIWAFPFVFEKFCEDI